MKIVIYSHNFLPQRDAESYCATRFASALARNGHDVTVVTMDWPMKVSHSTYDALVDSHLKIIRVPFGSKRNYWWCRIFYRCFLGDVVDVPESVRAVRSLLQNSPDAILVTRTHPIMSLIVGWKCRKLAKKWIAHLSDPIPWFGFTADTIKGHIDDAWIRMWVRRAFLRADAISVTCEEVGLFYQQFYGDDFDPAKMFVTTHIGDYRLTSVHHKTEVGKKSKQGVKRIIHPGSIYFNRGGMDIADAVRILNESGRKCCFVQVGEVDAPLRERLEHADYAELYDTVSPEKSIEISLTSDVVVVPDFKSPLPYSAQILSKFVYQLMDDKPIVIYGKDVSAHHSYAKRYPEAGIIWALEGDVHALAEAIWNAVQLDAKSINRVGIRREFEENTVAKKFERDIAVLDA